VRDEEDPPLNRFVRAAALPSLVLSLWGFAPETEAAIPDVASLRSEVSRLIRGTGWGNSDWGVLAVSLERGDTLFALEPDRPLAPASNQKLFTTAAALHYLGPEYRFPTFLLTDGEVRDGVLEGNLILYGTGDPAISSELLDSPMVPWRAFASRLRELGVHTVSGNVTADASFFRGPSRSPSWSDGYLNDWYAAPVSSLTFAENVATLRFLPGALGAPARVAVTPEGIQLPLLNGSVSVPAGSGSSLRLVRDHPDDPVELRGQIAAGSRELSRVITISDPATASVSSLRKVLQEEGVAVRGSLDMVTSAEASALNEQQVLAPAFERSSPLRTLAVHYSPPLKELIQILNKQSHNLYAEILLFTVGRVTRGDASFVGGAAALEAYLRDVVGLDEQHFHVEDGSGLSALNRATPFGFIQLLRHVSAQDYADSFWESLPEAGNRRELRRMYQSAAAGNLKAKTGTIRRVSALSGIVRSAEGEAILFSILSNGVPSTSGAKRIEDAIGIELASFSRPSTAPAAD
jgi:D-alanyl-D-alanine carboxypeptidase/D-alanyl-D-alanine-endopeptidase (penicillin-binding protein 4)